jgi:hypothetical protein
MVFGLSVALFSHANIVAQSARRSEKWPRGCFRVVLLRMEVVKEGDASDRVDCLTLVCSFCRSGAEAVIVGDGVWHPWLVHGFRACW